MSTDASESDTHSLSINEYHLAPAVERVVQLDNWDCGVACTETVLRSHGRNEPTREQLIETIGTRSPWTVDFALALRGVSGLSCTLFTTQASATHAYADLDFYKAAFVSDEERVNAAFARARALDVPICVRSVPLDELLEWLVDGALVIALVDARFLRCACCDDDRPVRSSMLPATLVRRLAAPEDAPSLIDRLLFPSKAIPASDDVQGYAGHYIVVCGFHRALRLVFFANPDEHCPELCAATFDVFDRARKQFGTDEDLIRIDATQPK
jgi:hypothetical protein